MKHIKLFSLFENENEIYKSYKDEDGDTIYKIPFESNTIEELFLIKDEDFQYFLSGVLSMGEGVETEDGSIFWASDIFDHMKNESLLEEAYSEAEVKKVNEMTNVICDTLNGNEQYEPFHTVVDNVSKTPIDNIIKFVWKGKPYKIIVMLDTEK